MTGEFLRVTDGNAAGAEIALEDELLIGRSASDEGALEGDSELSREHARITRGDDGGLVIEDLDSTNGTLVNGERITALTAIGVGDEIAVGVTKIEVASSAQPTAVAGEPPPVATTRVAPQPPPEAEGPPPTPAPAAGGPPPVPPPEAPAGGPPSGVEAPPGGPPPGVGGPPAGVAGGPPAGGGPPAAMMAHLRRRMIMTGAGGFVVGFAIAAAIFKIL
jgi:FHA domain-containing protein